MQRIPDDKLADYLISALETTPYPLEILSGICRLVFQVPAYPCIQCGENDPGIWIENDMAGFVCLQCGNCCQRLDYADECTEEDYHRWQNLGCNNILDRVMVLYRKDNKKEYKIWMEPDTQTFHKTCPWLEKIPHQNNYRCLIQDVKPEICRDYPFTRKHAIMTGCNGEFKITAKNGIIRRISYANR